jgi:hypothetical protein
MSYNAGGPTQDSAAAALAVLNEFPVSTGKDPASISA